jgi:hypothetical protein
MGDMYRKHAARLAAALLTLLPACHTRRPLTTPVPAAETQIVAQITDSGVVAMSNALGPGAVEVEGVVAAADAESWELRIVRVDYRNGSSMPWNRELVRFPRSTLANPTEKRLDKRKSWLAAGLITATALLVARLFGVIGGGDNPDTPPPPPN